MMHRQTFYINGRLGGRYCLATWAEGVPRAKMIMLPPFADEMNKARRMCSLAAAAFARQGCLVLQLDLLGTGDSAGDFGDATWEDWLDDVDTGVAWLEEAAPSTPLFFFGLRTGCLLACNWLRIRGRCDANLLCWQPVMNGKQFLGQFLRLKVANDMLGEAKTRSSTNSLRASLEQEEMVEVAGYALSPALATDLARAEMRLPEAWAGRVAVFEVAGGGRHEPSPAIARWIDSTMALGAHCEVSVVQGAPFWQTSEIEEVPELVKQSQRCLLDWLERA